MTDKYLVKRVNYYRVTVDGKTAYYTKYEELGYGFAKVMRNGKWGLLNPSGQVWGRIEFSKIHGKFCGGFIRVEKNGKFGYADKESGRFIGCIFDYAEDFVNGRATVKYKGKMRVINAVGKFVD